jgi:NADH-quinone oxidoreductase subunit F
VTLLDNVAKQIAGKCLCALGEFSVMAVTTGIKQFRADFDEKVNQAAGQQA